MEYDDRAGKSSADLLGAAALPYGEALMRIKQIDVRVGVDSPRCRVSDRCPGVWAGVIRPFRRGRGATHAEIIPAVGSRPALSKTRQKTVTIANTGFIHPPATIR